MAAPPLSTGVQVAGSPLGAGGKAALGAGATGATLGAFFGGPVGSALVGYGAQGLADYFSPQARALRQQSKKDIADLQQGKLGLSEAEKRTMLAGTQRALQAQTAGVEANLRRQAAATGGFGRSGSQTRALSQMVAGQQEKMAQSVGQVDALSQQKAQQRFADIMNRLQGKRAEQLQTAIGVGSTVAQAPASYGTYSNYVKDAEKRGLGGSALGLMGAASLQAELDRKRAAAAGAAYGG